MFHCERCKSSFNPSAAAAALNCPRCKGRDGVEVPLHFRLFEAAALRAANSEARVVKVNDEASAAADGPSATA